MKIISLKASNVKRLVAVDITPDGKSVIIGGRNDQGKSSVLDAIAMALGGAKLVPPEPIRQGADEATIEVDLGEYLVTRKFRRVYKDICGPFADDQPHAHSKACSVATREVTSTLTVASKPKGDEPAARFSSPQQLLDKIMGSLAFDPLTFVTAHETDQLAILKRVVKLDTSDLDATIKDLEAKRTQATRDHKSAMATFESAIKYDDAPAQAVSVTEVAAELEAASALKDVATAADQQATTVRQQLEKLQQTIATDEALLERRREMIANKQREIRALEDENDSMSDTIALKQQKYAGLETELGVAIDHAKTMHSAVPDVAFIKRRLQDVENLNKKYAANEAWQRAKDRADETRRVWDNVGHQLVAARDAREARVQEAKFPINGLAFGDNGVLYNGLPFKQASTALKLRTSVAIGLALNPTVKVLLIREGAFLDEQNLELVGKMADDANAQVWIERVGTAGVSVVIEDGKVQV